METLTLNKETLELLEFLFNLPKDLEDSISLSNYSMATILHK